jgi:ABC-type polar amino acid transport system ATPase subunit
MIIIDDVRKSFGAVAVLKGISLQIEKGETVCLIGASGSGKSTLLQCINGLEPINGGRILVDSIEVHARGTNLVKLRRGIGVVFQQYNPFPHLTAIENVALAPRIVLRKSRREAGDVALKQLRHVGLEDRKDFYPSDMSGGQQQRLAIARALAMQPSYLLLDEITSALDPELVGEVLDTLRLLRAEGMTMIVVTHEISFAREAADRVAFLHEGEIHEVGPAKALIDDPVHVRTKEFLGNFHRRHA